MEKGCDKQPFFIFSCYITLNLESIQFVFVTLAIKWNRINGFYGIK